MLFVLINTWFDFFEYIYEVCFEIDFRFDDFSSGLNASFWWLNSDCSYSLPDSIEDEPGH